MEKTPGKTCSLYQNDYNYNYPTPGQNPPGVFLSCSLLMGEVSFLGAVSILGAVSVLGVVLILGADAVSWA